MSGWCGVDGAMVKMSLQKKLKEQVDKSLDFHGCSGVIRGIIRQLIDYEFREVADKIREDEKRDIDKRWEQFKEQNKSVTRNMKTTEFYAFNVGYELAKKEDLGLLVEGGALRTKGEK